MFNVRAIRLFFFLEASLVLGLSSVVEAQEIKLDLETAIKMAVERNLGVKAKREELGIAEGKSIRANL